MVSTMREEPALARLDEIEEDLAHNLREGILFPERRAEAAAAVLRLHREAQALSERPDDYRPPEPWEIENEQRRHAATRYVVTRVFRDAPAGDPLSEGLVDHWTARLTARADEADQKGYERESELMREDAQTARRTQTSPCPLRDPETPTSPGEMLNQLRRLTVSTKTKMAARDRKRQNAWDRAAIQALETLEATILWVQEQGTINPEDPPNSAATGQVMALAREFNEIRFAIGERCRS